MAPNFSKNAILVGMVDYFCLVCETHLKNERETDAHISKPVHQKLLEAIQYVEGFKAEGIKKIKDKYFCELCNKMLSMQPTVRLHITEQPHIDNKNKNSFKRVGNYVIAFEKVAICDQSWNGLNENSCAVCKIEYENKEIHRNQPTHIVNVIQIQLEFDSDHNIYRKIDEYYVHCLTCNTLLGINSLSSHFVGEEHKKLYQACCNVNKDLITKSETIKKESTIAEPKSVQNDKVDSSKPEVKINNLNSSHNSPKVEDIPISVHDENKEAICKTQGCINNLNNSSNSRKVKDIPISVFDENEEAICKTLGCVNYITRDESNKLWCILCDNVMSISNVNTHVNEKHHQTILKLHKKRLHRMKTNNLDGKEDNKEVVKEEEQQDNRKKDSDEILEKLNNFQKDDIQINFETNTAFCKKCSMHIEFVCEAIETHILEHNKKETKSKMFDLKVTDTKKTLFTSPVHIKRNNNEGNKNATPNKNEKSKKNVTTITNERPIKNETSNTKAENLNSEKTNASTVKSNNDKENIPKNAETKEIKSIDTMRGSSPKPKKPKVVKLLRVPFKMFIRSCEAVEHMVFRDIIINRKYCINFLTFCFLDRLGGDTLRCQVCEVCIQECQFNEHVDSPRHMDAMNDMSIILNDETEFLREIRPGSFQCGFCNWVEPSWEDMSVHLKSSFHKESKNAATWRKELYAPLIERQGPDVLRVENVMDNLINQFL